MRAALRRGVATRTPGHVGLAFDVWAQFGTDGKFGEVVDKEREKKRDAWLDDISSLRPPDDYQRAYERFRQSLLDGTSVAEEGTLVSRLLVGHGNASPVDVGLTVHHTWGVPVIPGSTLKGLLSHYLQATYGPDGEHDPERARFAGPGWSREGDRARLTHAPGDIHRAIFGAPDVPDAGDDARRASQGRVVFHDALFIPGSVERPFARDVLTVHQRKYYGQGDGARSEVVPWPSDHDDPTPVPFLTVKPGTGFLIALGGDAEWAAFALGHLKRALVDWGAGGKTVAGYGRFSERWKPTFTVEDQVAGSPVEGFLEWLEEARAGELGQRQILAALQADWAATLAALTSPAEREAAGRAIRRVLRSPKLKAEVEALLAMVQG